MKINPISIIMVLAVLFIVSCNTDKDSQKDTVLLSKNVEYDVTINNYKYFNQNPLEMSWLWYWNNIEASSRMPFIELLFEKILSGKLKITDMNNKPVDSAHIRPLLFTSDTITITRPFPPYEEYDTVIEIGTAPEHFVALRFREEWTYNPATMAISKKVLAFAPMKVVVRRDSLNNEVFDEPKPLLWVMCDNKGTKPEILTKRIVYNIDFSSDFQSTFNLDSVTAAVYVKALLKKVYNDSIPAYGNSIADSLVSGAEIYKKINRCDTVQYKKPGLSTVTYDSIINEDFPPITVFRFLEEWSFDISTLAITKKVVGLCLVNQDFDMVTGEFRGYRPIFWVYFSDVWEPFKGNVKLKKK